MQEGIKRTVKWFNKASQEKKQMEKKVENKEEFLKFKQGNNYKL